MNIADLRAFAGSEGVFIVSVIAAIFVIPQIKAADWVKVFSTLGMTALIIILFTGGDIAQPFRWLFGLFGINF